MKWPFVGADVVTHLRKICWENEREVQKFVHTLGSKYELKGTDSNGTPLITVYDRNFKPNFFADITILAIVHILARNL